MVEPLTLALGFVTLGGAVAGILKWYRNNSVKSVSEKFKNENVHNTFNMKMEELDKDYKFLLERQIKLEEDLKDALREISELRGKIE